MGHCRENPGRVGNSRLIRIWILFFILICFVFLASVRLHLYPHPWSDEALYIDVAYNLLKEGKLGTSLYSQVLKQSERLYSNMPGLMLLIAATFKIFGDGLLQARALSVAFGTVAVVLTYILGKRFWGWRVGLVAAALMVANHLVIENSRTVLPEMPTLALGLTALALYLFALKAGRPIWFGLSGLASSLACLFHPLGLPIMGGLAVWLWLDRREAPRRAWIWVAVGAAVGLLPYLAYVLADPQEYWAQNYSYYYVKTRGNRNLLANLLWEVPARYFGITKPKVLGYILAGKVNMRYWVPQVGLVGLTTLVSFLVALLWAPGKSGRRLAALMVTCALFLALHPNKFPTYLVIFAPFISLILAGLFFHWGSPHSETTPRKSAEWAVLSIGAIFVLSQASYVVWNLTASPLLNDDYFGHMARLEAMIPEGSAVLAHDYYWIGLHRRRRFITTRDFVYAAEKRVAELDLPYSELKPRQRRDAVKETFEQFRPTYFILTKVHGLAAVGSKEFAKGIAPDVLSYLKNRAVRVSTWPNDGGYKNLVEHFWKGVTVYRLSWVD